MRWDPQQYGRFADERGRPFLDLIARIGASSPRRVVDLGCGPGTYTALLAERWPSAAVEGIDSSAEMIDAAAAAAPAGDRGADPAGGRLTFRVGDVVDWDPSGADVVISNATLQWVPTHRALVSAWAAALPPGGWLAFQVPGNFDSFSHVLMRSQAESQRWASSLRGILRHDDAVGTPEEYAQLLLAAGLRADVWETTYVHVLAGADPVLEWLRGTGLRPIMQALPPASYALFEEEFAAQLRQAYPSTPHGTLFPFRRVFAVGTRPS
jgi:trans-aconitate 2-methyltransferase